MPFIARPQIFKVFYFKVPNFAYLATETFTQTNQFPDGSSVTYTVSKNEVSIYEYEVNTNEAKRNINIINSIYATQLENQFQSLVSA